MFNFIKMKKKILSLMSVALITGAFFLTNVNEAHAGDKGTLYGNSSGTKFCCKSGTNDCSAAGCGSALMQ